MNAAEPCRSSSLLSTPIQSLQRALQSNIHYTLTLTRLIAPLIIQRTSRGSVKLRNTHTGVPDMLTHTNNATIPSPVNIGGGRILFVDSLLSTGPAPAGYSLYAASKAFVSSIAQVRLKIFIFSFYFRNRPFLTPLRAFKNIILLLSY